MSLGSSNTVAGFVSGLKRLMLAAVMIFGLLGMALFVGPREALVLGIGLGIGLLFEGLGFGFAGPWRRMIVDRDPSALFAQIVSIGLVAIIAIPLLSAASDELIGAHAPVGVAMIGGAFVFGAAMQIILGCGSGTLVNAGSGNPIALVALPFFAIGSFLGAFHLFQWSAIASLPVIVFTGTNGLLITLAGLFVLFWVIWYFADKTKAFLPRKLAIAALILALLAVGHLIVAGQPWGVVYGLGLWVAKLITAVGVDLQASSFWSHPIQAERLTQSILTDMTSLTNIGLILGAFAINIGQKGNFSKPVQPLPMKAWLSIIVAGFLLGYSSRLAFGCNVGAFFSGISTGSLHGWVWLIAAFAGSIMGIKMRRVLGLESKP